MSAAKTPMLPIAVLMIEHRLIERMVRLWEKQLEVLRATAILDPEFIGRGIDFMRSYVDKFHHGKEENILFAELKTRNLAPELKKMLEELIEDHKIARITLAALESGKETVECGDKSALKLVGESIERIVQLYPQHIYKEDKQFFIPVMDYFSQEEREKMLSDFRRFDPKTQNRYAAIINSLEKEGA